MTRLNAASLRAAEAAVAAAANALASEGCRASPPA